ncbi:hypothetical protein [Halobacteriovorax sp.]|uniref:hypothetical protein n=1 Tax=Halobacteriovorax sp. TaxID=2020862 RepID=UPI003AF25EB3
MTYDEFLLKIKECDTLQIIGPMLSDTSILNSELASIYVDGGLNHYRPSKLASLSIGDNDSNISDFNIDIRLNPEKDLSDLDAALELIPNNITNLYFFGFSGGRADHQLFNLGSIHHFLKDSKNRRICYIDRNIQVISAGHQIIKHNGPFSIISLEKQKIKIYGECKYKLQDWTSVEALSSLTLSNIGNGEVHLESELPLFIYLD